ncbi:MAG TPA: DUF2207 domain-containing protein [Actinomycetota bacterium]|nr:DUF2207 domain-containing protein [Actinomycetota bacterium]
MPGSRSPRTRRARRVRILALLGPIAAAVLATALPAGAQTGEVIHDYRVRIEILSDGDLRITERIDYDFGDQQRHGIFRSIPTRAYFDETRDRVTPVEVESVTATNAPDDVDVTEEGSSTIIRVGDPDVEITGRHTYTLVYRVEGALNAFDEHDELYWNAIGPEWQAPIESAHIAVVAPGPITETACYQGYQGSTEPCAGSTVSGPAARFVAGRVLQPYEGVSMVTSFRKGVVPAPQPIYVERWSVERAFSVNAWTIGASAAVAVALGGFLFALWSREGRDRRYVGSPVDQVLGTPSGRGEPVPLGEGDAEAPVEFAPPEDVRPGQIGTLIDERANVIDVTVTIVDLAGRGYVVIQEIPDEGWFSKTDWNLVRLEKDGTDLMSYERRLLDGLFRDGNEVKVSELKTTFADRLHGVEDALYADAMRQKWFRVRPDRARTRWSAWGVLLVVVGGAITFALARWTHWGIVGIPVILGGIALALLSRRMPARTAKGTAMLRRVRGFRRVIATAETHMSRWAEQENVFTRFLPYAIVFGLTEKWAKAFQDLGLEPETSSWYVGSRPFTAVAFADSIGHFSVTTGGTLAATPASSGSSGFGGGGFSGGGGGGGGGGSW